MAKEIKNFEIIEHIAVLSQDKSGWTKEVNRVSWFGGDAKVDIRSWGPDREKVGKGISLTDEEAEALRAALDGF